MRIATWIAVLIAARLFVVAEAKADSVADFYRGKTVTILIDVESGAAVRTIPHALAQAMRKYVPGEPTFVVQTMPGAGGIKAADYINSVAPQDGTYWGFINRGIILDPLLKVPQANFDPTKLNWIGSPLRSASVGIVWAAASPVRTIEDATKQEVIVGATSAGEDTGIYPAMLNKFIGTKFKVVTGYASVYEVDLAMGRGELQGKIGVTWANLNAGSSIDWVKDKKVAVLVQFGVAKSPDIPADVPLALDLAANPADREAMEVICGPTAIGYPSFMGPGVPPERVAAIRSAYQKALKDPEFLSAMQGVHLAVDPIGADEISTIVKKLYTLPPEAVASASALIPRM